MTDIATRKWIAATLPFIYVAIFLAIHLIRRGRLAPTLREARDRGWMRFAYGIGFAAIAGVFIVLRQRHGWPGWLFWPGIVFVVAGAGFASLGLRSAGVFGDSSAEPEGD
jgi:hypothetical protein